MAIGKGLSSRLDKRVRIERPVANPSFTGAGSGNWSPVCTVSASLVDVLPSRGERQADGINLAARPARLRIRFRRDITAAMRIVLLRRVGQEDVADRVMQIVAGPAEVGTREWSEFMVEDYSTAGNGA